MPFKKGIACHFVVVVENIRRVFDQALGLLLPGNLEFRIDGEFSFRPDMKKGVPLSNADFQVGRSDQEAEILRFRPDHRVRPEPIAVADPGVADDCHVAVEQAAVTELNVRTDSTERTDLDIPPQFRPRIDVRQW